jgi:hypothetical protein
MGTTALVQKPVNSIWLGTLDEADSVDGTVKFGPKRLIADVEYKMVDAFASQSITLGSVVQEDLRPESELTPVGTTEDQDGVVEGGRVDTQYVTLKLSGALAPMLYHSTYYTLNSGRQPEFVEDASSGTGFSYQYETFLAHMAGMEVTWFLPDVLNSRAELFGQFSTGDTAWSGRFLPISPASYSDVYSPEPGNSAHIGVSYSLRPQAATGADVLQTELKTVAYFETAGAGYVGTDVDLAITAVPLSDVRLVLKNGLFVPSAASENVKYQVTLQGVLRF